MEHPCPSAVDALGSLIAADAVGIAWASLAAEIGAFIARISLATSRSPSTPPDPCGRGG